MATKIAIIGPGRLGKALAGELFRAGYSLTEVISRANPSARKKSRRFAKIVHARAATIQSTVSNATLFWLCVPDREIASVARELATRFDEEYWRERVVFHSSGALASDELKALRTRGAAIASVHPLMTFVGKSAPSLRGVPFAIEGDAAAVRQARQIVKRLGGTPFAIRKKHKAAYHAWATFCSPMLIATLVAAEQAARLAGFSAIDAHTKMLPIVKQTIANYAALGPAGAFSGPIVRGDAAVVMEHLKVLRAMPEVRAAYVALARVAVKSLPVKNRGKLKKVLQR